MEENASASYISADAILPDSTLFHVELYSIDILTSNGHRKVETLRFSLSCDLNANAHLWCLWALPG